METDGSTSHKHKYVYKYIQYMHAHMSVDAPTWETRVSTRKFTRTVAVFSLPLLVLEPVPPLCATGYCARATTAFCRDRTKGN
jgi:hypothetical protein